ncbi:PREDICTED: uncharacterized protein At5g39865 [Tarenaya hassleriana]|uniref:uncharacterized protein At5g39865 n=1 Tax=Tarenaya hassleriana TaxID=28532 RepID=UPI00053CA36F|nr:PREDICTED: uncharacterized protein At5g39865 [Tarenaya hassleriana]XP_010554042.1 PREDICTED: uncharacterized protein At5g39865 [Tarenaya hassleriana]
MGCASSKQHKRCRHCRRGLSPVVAPRSYSMHVHHPATHTGDSYHMVALTSSTIGSLNLCDTPLGHNHKDLEDFTAKLLSKDDNGDELVVGNGFHHGEGEKNPERGKVVNLDLQAKLMEAKVWSSMMNKKIPKIVPKTPVVTPPGEPETINTWELMEGLEDISPLRSPNHLRSFSFDIVRSPPKGDPAPFDLPKSRFHENGNAEPMMFQMEEDEDCNFLDFDPEIISSFRKSLQELPPDHPFHIRIPDMEKNPNVEFSDEQEGHSEEEEPGTHDELICKRPSFGKDKVILYFTSLRGIRKTYEDCCHVRVILKGLGIRVDERDVSMHSDFKDELKELLGDKFNSGAGVTLPRVFLGRKYLGGAEEIRKLNEDGKLEKLLEGCERAEDITGYECEACGDLRFVPCDTCSGSCKVYYECEDHKGEEEGEEYGKEEEAETEYGFQRCPDCNENGLIRCPVCCD